MIEKFVGDCNIDFDPQQEYFESDDVESTGGFEFLSSESLFDDPIQIQRANYELTEEEEAEDLAQEKSKAEIDLISQLNEEQRAEYSIAGKYRLKRFPARQTAPTWSPDGYSASSDYELFESAQKGDMKARNALIIKSLGLASRVAYGWKLPEHLDYDDLFQSAIFGTVGVKNFEDTKNSGLARAIEKFDPKRGFQFSTLATVWIKHVVQRAIENFNREIRIPVNEDGLRGLGLLEDRIKKYSRDLPVSRAELISAAEGTFSADEVDEYMAFPKAEVSIDSLGENELNQHINDGGLEEVISGPETIEANIIKLLDEANYCQSDIDLFIAYINLSEQSKSYKEVAEDYDIPPHTASYRLQKLITRLGPVIIKYILPERREQNRQIN